MQAPGQDESNDRRAAEVFERRLLGLAAAAGGVCSVLFVDRGDARQMLGAYQCGDPQAAAYVRVIDDFVTGLGRLPRKQATLCLTCDRRFGRKRQPLIISVILPYCDQPANALVSGVCRACGAGRAGWPASGWRERLAELVTPRLRELCGPETRFAEPIHLGAAGMA